MDLMEYKAKEYFETFQIPGPRGVIVGDPAELAGKAVDYPCMVKAQVQVGGRGKAGGIKSATNAAELQTACKAILGMDIKGHVVRKVLIAGQVKPVQEWYLAITLDRVAKAPVVIFSTMGGMDIEEVARTQPEKIVKVNIDPIVGIRSYIPSYLASKTGVDAKYTTQLRDILGRLYRLFLEGDCLLAEINPLAVTEDDRLQALDAKVTVDDSALYRHQELFALRDEMESSPFILEGREAGFLFIPCDPAGTVTVISNGSGMIMSCIDILAKNGMAVCAAIDLGGGATAGRVGETLRIGLSDPKAKAVFINIFGGITRCDEVADGVRNFMDRHGTDKPVIVRFEGTNKEKGVEILNSVQRGNVVFVDGLYEGVGALMERKAAL